jgi:hypothetical protein
MPYITALKNGVIRRFSDKWLIMVIIDIRLILYSLLRGIPDLTHKNINLVTINYQLNYPQLYQVLKVRRRKNISYFLVWRLAASRRATGHLKNEKIFYMFKV